jgi:hypothetical protein
VAWKLGCAGLPVFKRREFPDPWTKIYGVVRYFGTRKKIFNVYFHSIRGHRNHFVEVYPDEGDVDLVKGDSGIARWAIRICWCRTMCRLRRMIWRVCSRSRFVVGIFAR